jgi:hypothetical protein
VKRRIKIDCFLGIRKGIFSLFLVTLFSILWLSFCSPKRIDILPDATKIYHSITLRVNVKEIDAKRRQNFKVVLKYDENGDKMLFLSPLNQVYGQLFINAEKVLLVSPKKKRYWRGTFNTLIDYIWDLNFTYQQFRYLILEGIIPEDKKADKTLLIEIELDDKDSLPKRIQITHQRVRIKLKLYNRKSGRGIINFSPALKNMHPAEIKEILQDKR